MHCLLCGHPRSALVGLFTPKRQTLFGAPPGKVRTMLYTLCGRCHRRRGWLERVEAKLMREGQQAAAAAQN